MKLVDILQKALSKFELHESLYRLFKAVQKVLSLDIQPSIDQDSRQPPFEPLPDFGG